MNSPSNHPLFQKLISLNLPNKDFAVFGSAPMWLHELKDLGTDIDIIARGEAWERAQQLGELTASSTKGNVIRLFSDEIEIFDVWAPGDWDTDEVIDNAEEVEGIKFASLTDVMKWKAAFGREKDLQHIALIEKYLAKNSRS